MGNIFKVNKEAVVDNFNEVKEIIKDQINQLLSSKIKIINYIEDSYRHGIFNNINDIAQWKIRIINYINYIYEGQDKEFEKVLISKGVIQEAKNKNKTKSPQEAKDFTVDNSKEENNKNLTFLTSKDIQNKLGEITREFENYSANFINDDEQNEKILGQNLLKIANLSRYTYNLSNNFLKTSFTEFEKKNKGKEFIISSPDEIKIQFYLWFKNSKNQSLIKSWQDQYASTLYKECINLIKETKDLNFMKKLGINLFELYFQSQLSFPPVEVIFLKEDETNFDSKRMIDFFDNRIGIKKVNFEYLPSFYSNGSFLENGKHWVYTYRKNKIFNSKDIYLLKLENNFTIPKLGDIIKFDIIEKKYLIPRMNYKIKEGINYEYKYFLENTDKKIREKNSISNIEIDDNEKLIKCDFLLMNKFILSFSNSKK